MAPFTQEGRLLAIDTPLGKDKLLLQSLSGHEAISRLFRFELDLLSEDPSIFFADIVGKRVSISMVLADESTRHFNGFVSRFRQAGSDARFTYYRAEVVPWLWFLTRTADCRIFQNMPIPDIITKIFKDLGFSDYRLALQGSFEPRDYCVQYRETDFNFVSRLMEQYGIFYFFEHGEQKHTLVLGNSKDAHKPCPGQESARCDFSGGAVEEEDVITSWDAEQEFRPGKYALTDYNFETPSNSLMVNVDSDLKLEGISKYELYDYPGEYEKKAQGSKLAQIRMEEEEAAHYIATGTGRCRSFVCGYKFDLTGHYRDEANDTYLITEIHHQASVGDSYETGHRGGGETYSNHFTCIPHFVPFRPARSTPKPIIQGVQTAVVVGRAGEEIYTDKYGRVKVQFHWDREGKKDENSSCWIRVSYPWAGKAWGGVAIPRIGQEVIVGFLEGDPDQPIITGRVYNAELMPPYDLPSNQTQSGMKSRSSKGGSPANFNEIRMEDKKGSEQLYIHAEKDESIVVENDKTESVGHDETITIGNDRTETVSGNETMTVVKDRTRTVNKNETVTVALTRTHTVGINEAITVGAAQEVTVGAMRALTVGASQSTTIGANHSENVGKNHTESIGQSHSETIGKDHKAKVGDNRSVSVGKDDTLSVGKKLVITAGEEVLIKTGDASLHLKKDGTIQIKGKDIGIFGSGKITAKADGDMTLKGSKIGEN